SHHSRSRIQPARPRPDRWLRIWSVHRLPQARRWRRLRALRQADSRPGDPVRLINSGRFDKRMRPSIQSLLRIAAAVARVRQFAPLSSRFLRPGLPSIQRHNARFGGLKPISVTAMPSLTTKMRFSRVMRRFASAREGNVAVIFAIALVPILGFLGSAIDYSRANRARSTMQAALDSAALMVSKDLSSGLIDKTQVEATAQKYFNALYTNKEATGITVTASYTASNGSTGSTIYLTGAGSITTDFMYLFGFPTMDFNTNTTTAWGFARLR